MRRLGLAVGQAQALLLSGALILPWLTSGPIFGFSDTWQLEINTGTTIGTFLMCSSGHPGSEFVKLAEQAQEELDERGIKLAHPECEVGQPVRNPQAT